jgi:aryl-alcohol dehydrogenase-like predicted oxidoreductase
MSDELIRHPTPKTRHLIMGTAQWGWNINQRQAFETLDAWLKAGHRDIDCATNYPINRQPADFRAAERILLEYIRAHGLKNDIRVTMKIGSLNNMRTPDGNLSPSFILMMGEEYARLFGESLHGIMLHWDNRSDADAISTSIEALQSLKKNIGIQPGLSGIAHPEVYAQILNRNTDEYDIQLKNNVIQSDMVRYAPLKHSKHRFWAYGINAGGLKLDGQYGQESTFAARGGQPDYGAAVVQKIQEKLPVWNSQSRRPPIQNMNQIGLIFNALHPDIHGVLLSFSNTDQMQETLDWMVQLEKSNYQDVFEDLT